MDDADVTLARLLDRWLRGEVVEDQVVAELRRLEARARRRRSVGYDAAFASVVVRIGRLRRQLYTPPELARERADRLIAVAPERVLCELQSRRDEWSPPVTDALLRRSREVVGSDPEEALRRAELAQRASWIFYLGHRESLGSTALLHDLRARSLAHQGNALRLRCRYADGQIRFERALSAAEQGSGDPLVEAEVCHLHGSLLRDRRHFAEARDALERSARRYALAGQDHDEAKVLISRAMVEREAGEPQAAVAWQQRAIAGLDFEAEPWWRAAAYTNLALFLAEAGEALTGRQVLAAHPLAHGSDERAQLHRRWIEGVVESAAGDPQRAIDHLVAAREGFAAMADGHRFAMATIDLAVAHRAVGDWVMVRELAAQSLALLNGLDVPRDAVAAFLVFERSVATDVLSVEALRRLRRGIEEPRLWRCAEQPS